ncbi:hypothetical protein GHK86_19425 [Acidimicrobiaceae bacterium USS-CC1]|jgi:hypothetical protein|uniref:Small CPxCG-related zinc finger protein n=1 Tax=Acidiferrimicrobium australe TaxID=2664430 RepID=A0ABW9QZI4_9ACTN|nr:hypothetical protein [Acidiferrimicrobium australe]
MTLRSITCQCGTSRPGSQSQCPNCGRSDGREVLERTLQPRRTVRPAGPPQTGDLIGCGLCGLARVRVDGSDLVVCPFCDTVRDID